MDELLVLWMQSHAAFAASAFIVGLVIGSFLNVVIYRLPIMLERQWRAQAAEFAAAAAAPAAGSGPVERFNLVIPRSACPACRAPIHARQNIPVVSWLMLRGRCAACGARISPRYPAVELLTGLLSAWVAWHFGFGLPALAALLLTWCLIPLTGIDLDHQLLPDDITLPLLWLGLLAAVVIGPLAGSPLPVAPFDAVVGAAAGYLSLWLIFQIFRLITGKEGMGYGDFKLFAALGAWLGWKLLPLIILLSAAAGAVLGLALIAWRGRDRAQPMPFGPYLACAGWLAMMYGDPLVSTYLTVAGLKH